MVTQAFRDEAYSEGTGQAYLILVTVDHADLAAPLRFTSDGVATTSNGEIFTPLAFRAVLPDRTQGRAPQATLRLDNVNKTLLEALRGLQTAPTVDLQVVRASDPDTVEDEYLGMTVTGTDDDPAFIDLTLALENLAEARFPPRVFDRSWEAVWES